MKRQSCPSTGEVSSDRKQFRVQRRWTDAEADQVLNYLLNTVTSGGLIEKPTAELYYQKMQQHLNFINCSSSQLKGKVKNMRKAYVDVALWRTEVGQGIRQSEGEAAFLRSTLRRCPKFELLDKVFSSQAILFPPASLSSDLPHHHAVTQDMMEPEVFIQEDGALSDLDCQVSEMMSTTTSNSSSPSCSPSPGLPIEKMESHDGSFLKLLCDARNQKAAFDDRRIELEFKKLEFEKQKWWAEVKLKHRELDLEEKRIENSYLLSRYELDLKYNIRIGLGEVHNHKS